MAWLKLTLFDDLKALVNMNNATDVIIVKEHGGSFISLIGDESIEVKESLEEIEAMLNKNEQSYMSEAVAKDNGRDYIGSNKDVGEEWNGGRS